MGKQSKYRNIYSSRYEIGGPGFDQYPNNRRVNQLGPHLNLQTQIDGVVQKGALKDPRIPIDPDTIRLGDY